MNYSSEEFWKLLDKLVESSEIIIDRSKGSRHPKYPSLLYEVDYGYLKNTTAMDGGGIDIWRGTDERQQVDGIICTIDLFKRDSEIKILIGCTEEEKGKVYHFHNNTETMKGILIKRC